MRGFAEASYEMTQGAMTPESQADSKLLVIFNMHPHPNQEKSAAEGRPIFEDKVYVTIIVPGDKESIVHRPAWEKDFQRFPRQYAAFKNNAAETVIGTPLKLMTWLSASQIKELEYFHIRTVEHLAEVSENVQAKMHGLHGLKKHAQDFLRASKDAAPMVEMRTELEKRDSQIEALQKQLNELGAQLTEQAKAKKDK